MELLNFILLGIAAVSCWGLTGGYIYFNRGWIRSDLGKMIVTVAFTEAILYTWVIIAILVPSIKFQDKIGTGIFATSVAALAYRLYSYIRIQADELRKARERN